MNSEIDKDKTNGKTDEIDEIIQRSILEEFEIFVDDLRLKYKLTEDEVCSIIRNMMIIKETEGCEIFFKPVFDFKKGINL